MNINHNPLKLQDKTFSMQRIQDLGEARLEVEAAPEFPLDTSRDLSRITIKLQTKGLRGRIRSVHILNLMHHLVSSHLAHY